MLLQVEHLCLSFGGLKVANDVSMDLEAGKVFALIGPNGAGKTTFFNLISGVYKPDSGSITFNGKRIDGMRPFQVNKVGITRTYQVINLFRKMSVLENVMVGMHSRLETNFFDCLFHTSRQKKEEIRARDTAAELLDFVGLGHLSLARAGDLSYGQQRLLEIVRAMASNPTLLLLDEPAAGMNTKEKIELDDLIQKILQQGITVLLVEHDMKLVMNIADKIFVLHYGEKIAEGSPAEIQKNPHVIEAYLGRGVQK